MNVIKIMLIFDEELLYLLLFKAYSVKVKSIKCAPRGKRMIWEIMILWKKMKIYL